MKSSMTTLAVAVAVSISLTGVSGYLILQPSNSEMQQAPVQVAASSPSGGAQKTVEYTLVAENTTLEISPGVRVEAWTYNGTIPGPVLRATEGDRVILHFINKTPMSHTVHLHGDHEEKADGVFQVVKPGKTFTYDFIAGPPGALMYHCHVMPVTQHIRMGLYGALIVDPKGGLSPAREYVLVAGEYDTKDQITNNPEYVFFNGYADQYWDHPLEVKANETVRLYYVNMGAGPAFGFHIHGTIFDAYQSGIWANSPVKVQTWEVAAGNGAIFEAKWPWEGRYLFHIHGLPEEKGTMGYFNVTNAPANAVDGVDVAKTKSISMIEWQENLIKELQKQDPLGIPNVKALSSASQEPDHGSMNKMSTSEAAKPNSAPMQTNAVIMPKGAAANNRETFLPSTITVNAGTTVTWQNEDNSFHIVASKTEGAFSSDLISPKKTFEHTFAEQGSYEYYCSLHPWMTGTVTVK